MGTNFAGYMFTKHSYWHKLRGLWFKLKAILLVQTARAFVQTQAPAGFSALRRAFTGCILIGWLQVTRWGWGIPPFHGNQNPSPGCLPAPAPAAPHNKTYFSASKTNKKKYQTHELQTPVKGKLDIDKSKYIKQFGSPTKLS